MTLSKQELEHILTTVSSVAIEVGHILAQTFNQMILTTEKTSPHDLVTQYDKESEEYIYTKLSKLYPSFGFLGEENGYRNYEANTPFWVVDPIDGTLNFSRSIPSFAVSIALVHHNKSYLGVCYNPISKELFTAYKGGGAFLNGGKLTIKSPQNFKTSVLSIPPGILLGKPLSAVIRRSGSTVIDICYVAKGAIDGYFDPLLNPWDFAAASLIAEEAGAEIFSHHSKILDTNKKSDILVANKHIVDEFLKWISTEER
jgi:myo-inositol-1(or 4)-monophosphatase